MDREQHDRKEARTGSTGLAKVAVQCSANKFVVNQNLVLRINICGKNHHLRQARERKPAIGGAYAAMLRSQISAPDVWLTPEARTLWAVATVNGCLQSIADINAPQSSPLFQFPIH